MRVTQAMAFKAMEGNVAAANWLSKTFMAGGLSQAAAAQAVGITAEAEMLVLGKSQHPEWAKLWETAAEQNGETAPAAPVIAAPPAAATGQREPEPYRPAPAEVETSKTVETVKTADEDVETMKPAKTVDSVTAGSTPSVAPPRPLTVPPSERVCGFRVTKGPRPAENRRKPSKRSAPSSVVSPPTAPCAAR
jgi:hypothetical protein